MGRGCRIGLIIVLLVIVIVIVLVAFGIVDITQTRQAKLPDVNTEGGQLPGYDVDTPGIDVGTEQKQITVPDIDVHEEQKTITLPDVDVKSGDQEKTTDRKSVVSGQSVSVGVDLGGSRIIKKNNK